MRGNSLEMFHKELDRGEAGDDMGTLLRGIKREQVRRGMVIAAAGSMKSHTKFLAQIYVSLSPKIQFTALTFLFLGLD